MERIHRKRRELVRTVRLSGNDFAEIRRIVELYVLEWELLGKTPPEEAQTLYRKLRDQ